MNKIKIAKVIQLYIKKNEIKDNYANYRPVSLQQFSKLLQKWFNSQHAVSWETLCIQSGSIWLENKENHLNGNNWSNRTQLDKHIGLKKNLFINLKQSIWHNYSTQLNKLQLYGIKGVPGEW